MRPETGFGIYIHIPFCQTKCNYCSFVSRPWHENLAERYWRAVLREIENFSGGLDVCGPANTIYFGGGTPSIVPAEHIAGILAACRRLFPVSSECEVSLEANPGTLTPGKAKSYMDAGVNRISMGAQSFDDRELVSIGRIHSADQVASSLELLRSVGFSNLNLDLILGLPSQTRRHWESNLRRIAQLAPPHISVYMLDLDPKAPLYHSVAHGECSLPEEDELADWYLFTIEFLAQIGYRQYEISNFALEGYESRHNLKYWLREPVLGFGVSSHSFDGRSRYANLAGVAEYLNAVEAGESPIEWRRPIDAGEELEETLFLGLRLMRGLDWQETLRRFADLPTGDYETHLHSMADAGLVQWTDSQVRLTPKGMLLSNEVFQEFVH